MQQLTTNTYTLSVHVVDAHGKMEPNVEVQVFRKETEPISQEQWIENLRNGASFKRLISSRGTDSNGLAAEEYPQGTYEVKVKKYCFSQTFELTQNVEVKVAAPKTSWWH
jgi:5-hydroxyisourate hydrolase-like protein (transthyretin family)